MILVLPAGCCEFLKKPLMLKLKITGKNFSPGILKLLHIRFVENGFKLWYNYVNVKLICGYKKIDENIFIICFWVCVNAFNLQPVNLLFLFPEFGKRRSIQIQPLSVFGIGKLVLAIGAFIFALVKGSALTVFSL